jgi:hypothetical protein
MGFLKRLLGLEPKLMKLLSARIITDEDHHYFVSFHRQHPELQLPEFVRLILHYYAKILFNFDPSDPEMSEAASILKKMMHSVLSKGISRDSDILEAADIADVASMVTSPPQNIPREIVATLFFVNTTQRHITTDIPRNIYAQHMVFSVIVLLQAAFKEMDQDCIEVLKNSLSNMNDSYASGESYSDMQNLSAIPTKAHLSAIMGE